MVGVNCLFNFDEVNYRLVIPCKNENQVITYDELKRALRDHPKLKEIDFFEDEKYVIEIFDKGFDEYIKLSKNATIPDYTKLRSRLRPKMSYKTVGKQGGESLKRPLLMYAENNLEEEQATKVLRGSPPPSGRAAKRARSPHSSSSTSQQSRCDTTGSQVRTNALSNRPGLSENSWNTLNTSHGGARSGGYQPSKVIAYDSPSHHLSKPEPPSPVHRQEPSSLSLQTSLARTSRMKPTNIPSYSTKSPPRTQPEVQQKPLPQRQPLPSSVSSSTKSTIMENLPTSEKKKLEVLKAQFKILNASEKYTLTKAIAKYNEEFVDIMLFDDIWETESVWPFIFKEITAHGLKDIENQRTARKLFKSLVDQYVALLKHTDLTKEMANDIWPLFDIFHKMDVRPFYKGINKIKETFDGAKKIGSNSNKELPNRTPEIQEQEQNSPKQSFNKAPIKQASSTQQTPVSFPLRETTLSPVPPSPPKETETASIPVKKSTVEVVEITSEEPTSTITTLKCSSDDFRLLLSVEDHNKEFYDELTPEYSVWREVTDQINLYKPFEPSLVMKYKTRFYELLKEYLRIEKSSISTDDKVKWKLYSSFKNLDIAPFLSKVSQY